MPDLCVSASDKEKVTGFQHVTTIQPHSFAFTQLDMIRQIPSGLRQKKVVHLDWDTPGIYLRTTPELSKGRF